MIPVSLLRQGGGSVWGEASGRFLGASGPGYGTAAVGEGPVPGRHPAFAVLRTDGGAARGPPRQPAARPDGPMAWTGVDRRGRSTPGIVRSMLPTPSLVTLRRLFACAVFAFVATSGPAAQAKGPATLKDLHRIAAGRPLAVVIIKGFWCSACTDQLQDLSKRLAEVRAAGGAVVGLSTDDPGTNSLFKRKLGLGFPVLGDPSGRLMERLGMWMPSMGHPLPGFIFLPPCGDNVVRIPGRRPGRLQTQAAIKMLHELASQATCIRQI